MNKFLSYLKNLSVRNGELGGYVHDTAMSQFIPVTAWHYATGTWTWIAGQVAKTIAAHKAAADQTTVISIPIMIPSNSVALKGAYLKSVEIDFEIRTAVATSLTPLIHLVTRGADTAVATVADQAFTQTPVDPTTVDQHKLVLTITTPFWIDNDQYVLVELSIPTGAGGCLLEMYGAVANFTLRV